MKLFIKNILLLAFILISFLQIVGYLLEYQFEKDLSNKLNWNKSIKNKHFSYAIVGDSRAKGGINVLDIDSECVTNGVNLGVDGASLQETYVILHSFLRNQKNKVDHIYLQISPPIVYLAPKSRLPIIDLYYHNLVLEENMHEYFKNPTLSRVYNFLPIAKFIEHNTYYDFKKLKFNILNKKELDSTKGTRHISYNGKIRLPQMNMDSLVNNVSSKEYNSEIFDKIYTLCKEEEISIELFTAPLFQYEKYFKNESSKFNFYVESISSNYKIKWYDFSNKLENKSEYFADLMHLNSKGAQIFTKYFIKEVEICSLGK